MDAEIFRGVCCKLKFELGFRGIQGFRFKGGTECLTSSSDHSEAVVFKIPEAVGTPFGELHL